MDTADDELIRWSQLKPRTISDADRHRFEGYLREIFAAMGLPADTSGTRRTPERFLRAMIDATDGYEGDENLRAEFLRISTRSAAA
jgi:GTP cyclohydrolase I